MNKALGLSLLVMILVCGVSYADNSNQVSVDINAFARISVIGAAGFTVNENDFVNGFATKEQDPSSNVQISVKTNSKAGCKVFASAPDFSNGAATFSSSILQVQVGNGGQFVPLKNDPTQIIDLTEKQSNTDYPVNFKLSGLPDTQDSGHYQTIVTYTVAVNS